MMKFGEIHRQRKHFSQKSLIPKNRVKIFKIHQKSSLKDFWLKFFLSMNFTKFHYTFKKHHVFDFLYKIFLGGGTAIFKICIICSYLSGVNSKNFNFGVYTWFVGGGGGVLSKKHVSRFFDLNCKKIFCLNPGYGPAKKG